jgi:hypothetical protein
LENLESFRFFSQVEPWELEKNNKPQPIFKHFSFEPHVSKVQLPTFSRLPCGNHIMLVYPQYWGINHQCLAEKKHVLTFAMFFVCFLGFSPA